MSERAASATIQRAESRVAARNALKIRRGGDCGQHTAAGHQRDECKSKRLKLHDWSVDHFISAGILNIGDREAPATRGAVKVGADLSCDPAHTTQPASSPAVDFNYEITSYRFSRPGVRRVQWKLGPRHSNVLPVEVVGVR